MSATTETDAVSTQNPPARPKKRRPRSAITSGRRLFIEGDPSSPWSRRYHDLVQGHCNDLGGRDLLSEAQLSLIRRASALAVELESMEARMSRGEQVNLDSFGRAAGHLRRILESLGLKRQPRTVLTLREQLELEAEAKEEAD